MWHVESKLGFIVCYMNWRHQIKPAGSSFQKVQRMMVLLAKGVGAAELCKDDAVNARDAQAASQKRNLQGTTTHRNSPSCPASFSAKNCQRTGKLPKTFALLCTNLLWNTVSNNLVRQCLYFFMSYSLRGPYLLTFSLCKAIVFPGMQERAWLQ